MKHTVALIVILAAGIAAPAASQARDYGDEGYRYGHRHGYDSDYRYRGYYPSYRPRNPVVSRDRYGSSGYDRYGNYHSEAVVEDRHSSYYSPGRNEAITKPQTSVESWSRYPGQETTRETTRWIGADGKPHSTTITQDTTTDAWGDSHTDTHVTLKSKPVNR